MNFEIKNAKEVSASPEKNFTGERVEPSFSDLIPGILETLYKGDVVMFCLSDFDSALGEELPREYRASNTAISMKRVHLYSMLTLVDAYTWEVLPDVHSLLEKLSSNDYTIMGRCTLSRQERGTLEIKSVQGIAVYAAG